MRLQATVYQVLSIEETTSTSEAAALCARADDIERTSRLGMPSLDSAARVGALAARSNVSTRRSLAHRDAFSKVTGHPGASPQVRNAASQNRGFCPGEGSVWIARCVIVVKD
jgi:hypothetical protein